MKNKAIFLDRDGTINVDYGYVYKIEDFEFIPGVIESLRKLQKAGFLLVIITNQSGIARGYYSKKDFLDLHKSVNLILAENGIKIDGLYFCPHLEGCECRKPKLKLFYDAAKDLNIDFSNSFAIGDRLRDLKICEKEPVKGFLITDAMEQYENVTVCSNMKQAVNIILKDSKFKDN